LFLREEKREVNHRDIESHVKQLQGEILTLVEASYNDPEQREAQKRLVRRVFSRKLFELFEGKKRREENEQSKRKGPNSDPDLRG